MNITTDRLNIRELTLKDAPFLVELLNSNGFIENIGDRGIRTVKQAEEMILEKYIVNYPTHGLFIVVRRNDHTAIGSVSFLKRDFLAFEDIGYAFLPDYFGKGYAFEAASALVNYAKRKGLTALNGVVDFPNIASQNLLLKLGFKEDGVVVMDGEEEPIKKYTLIF
ncbi:GNAT family N-acetyltransferase [Psychrosphaera sp. B3R10]|uniref:GNAT family N-acetyltransferase n=1 Tax=unclassified Psychrosphaera TaxID=2641570 RepID=UPI001C08FDE0|nr:MULTISPECIES: GNAT family N-acetyltransferase [unclassified Psychrosphaera]MBU2881001.1 GNAT family N-acetyltransferase [Psychrosphaera sp. I2R16]MBU2990780.1 GNAT family N-acetyltransferase [Psychrosphaera sp. B3R10]